jgi:hypothetical protein
MKLFKFILLMFACVMQGTILAASVAAPQEGEASYYADSLNGRKTASGELYDKSALSAAHRSLPFGTKVRVTYLKPGNQSKSLSMTAVPMQRAALLTCQVLLQSNSA